MSLEKIAVQLKRSGVKEPAAWGLENQAAVLVSLLHLEDGLHFLFTKRTDFIATHKGQVSFPGGRADKEDLNPLSTALRETKEEIGVSAENIQVLGLLETFPATNSLLITPVVGILKWPIKLTLSEAEVSRVFTVPVGWFKSEAHKEYKTFTDHHGVAHPVIYYRAYSGDIVWGITAYIINNFLRTVFD